MVPFEKNQLLNCSNGENMAVCFLQITTVIALILCVIPPAKSKQNDYNQYVSTKCLSGSPTIIDCLEFNECCIKECVERSDLTFSICSANMTRSDWECVCGTTLETAVKLAIGAIIGIIVGGIVLVALCIGGIILCICCCARKRKQQGAVFATAGQQVQYNAQYKAHP